MAEPYLGEIRIFPWDWPPKGWAPCDGRLLAIQTNQALFSLLGVQYGGNGTTTFALPDLRGRVAMHVASGLPQGAVGGLETVALTVNNLPQHSHPVMASTGNGDTPQFSNSCMAKAAVGGDASSFYGPSSAGLQPLALGSVNSAGGNQAHENCQPSLVLAPCIALIGIYPSRN